MKINIGSIQRVEAVKCGVYIWNFKAYSFFAKFEIESVTPILLLILNLSN
jgi:hypothetical protein